MILPQPGRAFAWVQTPAGAALVCRGLEQYARHLFTTRPWALGSATSSNDELAWADVARALDVQPSRLHRVRQVHGAKVAVRRRGLPAGDSADADVIVTDDPWAAVAVRTADCVPLLLSDARTGMVAAAHAGWKGLVLRVPAVTVQTLCDQFGSRPSDLVAAIGPSIGACCYEIGGEVREQFGAARFSGAELSRWFSAEPRRLPLNPAFTNSLTGRRGHWFLDIWAVARDQLIAEGVSPDRIHVAELCTASHATAFCSYRRDGSRAGRLAAAIRRR